MFFLKYVVVIEAVRFLREGFLTVNVHSLSNYFVIVLYGNKIEPRGNVRYINFVIAQQLYCFYDISNNRNYLNRAIVHLIWKVCNINLVGSRIGE